MDFKEIQERITELNEKTRPKYHLYTQKEKEILAKMVKLSEEVGELSNDILSVLRLQRRSKLDKFERKNIYEEFADVIIATVQLASVTGVDIERAVLEKLEKIDKKYTKDK